MQGRPGRLGADQQRHHAVDQEEGERRDQLQVAAHLVVGSGQPLHHELAQRAATYCSCH
jgi:hypothetical protein